ncbi:unnamed protein product [Pieris macdunnoughi]|uniref:Uncharacterized protein n=1 Tax=Pieris macdunnoughi TaxID=345717 RepID=A0A821Y5F6_9NEOP|nr:unnamed protein product [Pieris macdunnoughi]
MRSAGTDGVGSSSSSEGAWPRVGGRRPLPSESLTSSTVDTATSTSRPSLTSSISRFRSDFEQLKCKARIFGESMNLCRCIADDYNKRLGFMEKRLINLEQRQRLTGESNYSAIIQKNQKLSHKTKQDVKRYSDKFKSRNDIINIASDFDLQQAPPVSPFDSNEILTYINKLKNDRSPGPDSIPNEALKIQQDIGKSRNSQNLG